MDPIHWMILVWLVILPVAFLLAIKLPTPSSKGNDRDT